MTLVKRVTLGHERERKKKQISKGYLSLYIVGISEYLRNHKIET